ncbi:Cell surface mannoprotein mp65 [Recurvomyces mirabilis]|nr:Cell surface mannoprotein mp65 [Recurvomyces mirabilis]
MKAGLLWVATLAAANAHPPHLHVHAAQQRQEADVVTVVDVVTNVAAVVYVDGNGNPVSTSYETQSTSSTSTTHVPAATTATTASSAAPAPTSSSSPPPPAPSSSAPSTSNPPPAAPSASAPSSPSAPSSSAASSSSSAAPANSGSAASGYSIAYSPYNGDGSCKTQDQVNKDFTQISGYSMIRIYGTDCQQTMTVGNAAAAKGMKLMAGVYDVTQVSTEVQHIIDAANGNFDHIDTVAIGNEGVNSGRFRVDQVVSAIGTARSMLQAKGYKGKVVTVDTFVAIIANPQLCQASDYAAANCHAFFDGGVTAQDAGKFVLGQAQRVSQACGGKDTMITETGWPSGGQANKLAVPSLENQAAAIASIQSAFSNNVVLFSAFNDYWKQNNAGTFGAEQYWGIHGNAP